VYRTYESEFISGRVSCDVIVDISVLVEGEDESWEVVAKVWCEA
jgi:hypothetical protein